MSDETSSGTSSSFDDEMMDGSTSSNKGTILDSSSVINRCAWGQSCVAGKLLGCLFSGLEPREVCYIPNCTSPKFHHGCQTEWETALHCHDFPGCDTGTCEYEAGFKYCMIHHPFGYLLTSHSESSTPLIDGVNLEDDDVRKEGEEAEKGVRKESAATKKSREMIEFAERQTIENVVLNRDKSDVETLGGTAWLSLSVKAKTAFLRKIKVMIPQNKRTGTELGSVVANWINSQGVRSSVAAVIQHQQKKPAAGTKPACATREGTLYRAINTIIACKVAYKSTRANRDRDDQDSHNPKAAAWDSMVHYYNDEANNDLNELLPTGSDALIGANVPHDTSYFFNVLKSGEFEQVVSYINAHYRTACNEKTQRTGNHGGFASYCHGKKWLIYYHALLSEEGNSDLNCFAFPTLPASIIRTSSSSYITPLKRKTSDSSVSGGRTRAITAASATIAAMGAMQLRMENLTATEEHSHLTIMKGEMMEWKTKASDCNREYSKLGASYLSAKSKGEKQLMKELLDERGRVKKQERTYTKEYERLKDELGYESAECSPASVPASLPSDDDISV